MPEGPERPSTLVARPECAARERGSQRVLSALSKKVLNCDCENKFYRTFPEIRGTALRVNRGGSVA